MPHIELPEGDYIHFCRMVRPEFAGRTRAVLMRARMLSEYGGVPTRITTYDDPPIYGDVRTRLRELGMLAADVELLNIFEYYRGADLGGRDVVDTPVPAVEGMTAHDEPHPDGTVHRTAYTPPGRNAATVVDFRRADGTVFLRRQQRNGRRGRHVLLDRAGNPVGTWPNRRRFVRAWLRELVPRGRRAFVFVDMPQLFAIVHPMPRRFRLIDVVHSTHLTGRPRWDGPVKPTVRPMLDDLADLDALVFLTRRQQQDVAARYGHTDNQFVVPNPITPAVPPKSTPARDRARFVVLARLHQGKRIGHMFHALAQVREQVPDATLDVFGEGPERGHLERLAITLGLAGAVRLHGFDQHARESLWTATAHLLTSRNEGYSLSIREAMSHGCPVISYDVKYGPADQITHGVDGYLVEPANVDALAERMLALVHDPTLAARMGAAAADAASRRDPGHFVRDWRQTLGSIVAQTRTRTRLTSCRLQVAHLGYARTTPAAAIRRRLGRPVRTASRTRTPPRIALLAFLHVKGRSRASDLGSAQVVLEAVCAETGELAVVPASVDRDGGRFRVTAGFRVAELFAHDPANVRLRLRLTWHNSAWQQVLARVRATGRTETIMVP